MIDILIIDDHKIIRDGIKQILSIHSDIGRIDEAQNGREGIRKAGSKLYNAIILDIGLPDTNGINVMKVIKQDNPATNILILSMYSEQQYAIRALRAGASGYLTKESSADDLLKAIRIVASGRKYITTSLAERMALFLDEQVESPRFEDLSDREFMVLQLIAQGESIGNIAKRTHLSVKTISTYRSRIFTKMGFTNNAELIRYSIQNNILS